MPGPVILAYTFGTDISVWQLVVNERSIDLCYQEKVLKLLYPDIPSTRGNYSHLKTSDHLKQIYSLYMPGKYIQTNSQYVLSLRDRLFFIIYIYIFFSIRCIETLQFLSGGSGIMFLSGQNKILVHNVLDCLIWNEFSGDFTQSQYI